MINWTNTHKTWPAMVKNHASNNFYRVSSIVIVCSWGKILGAIRTRLTAPYDDVRRRLQFVTYIHTDTHHDKATHRARLPSLKMINWTNAHKIWPEMVKNNFYIVSSIVCSGNMLPLLHLIHLILASLLRYVCGIDSDQLEGERGRRKWREGLERPQTRTQKEET